MHNVEFVGEPVGERERERIYKWPRLLQCLQRWRSGEEGC